MNHNNKQQCVHQQQQCGQFKQQLMLLPSTQTLHRCRRSSYVARAHTNDRRQNMPQPEDKDQGRREPWYQKNLAPKPRPVRASQPAVRHQQQQQLDWRSYRAKLVQMERASMLMPGRTSCQPWPFDSTAWAHELPGPEAGCLLVARQEGMDFFAKTVVLLAVHDPAVASVGFVLNKPCPLQLSEAQLSEAAKGVLDTFGSQQLQLGGPVQLDNLTVLHSYAGLQGAHKVSEGIYYGGLPAAVDLVRCGLAKPHEFRLMLGMAGWGPSQLQDEINSGAWHVVAAAKELVVPLSHSSSSSSSTAPPSCVSNINSSSRLFSRLLELISHPHQKGIR